MKTLLEKNDGITLLETLFAMFIAGVAIFAATLAFPKTSVMVNNADYRAAAVRACQTEIEQFKKRDYAFVPNIDPDTHADYPKPIVLDAGLDIDGVTDTGDDYFGELNTTITSLEVSGTEIGKRIYVECTWVSEQTLEERSVVLDALMYKGE